MRVYYPILLANPVTVLFTQRSRSLKAIDTYYHNLFRQDLENEAILTEEGTVVLLLTLHPKLTSIAAAIERLRRAGFEGNVVLAVSTDTSVQIAPLFAQTHRITSVIRLCGDTEKDLENVRTC